MDPDMLAALTDHSGTPREQATRMIGLLFPPDVAERIDAEFGEIVADARAQLSRETLEAQEEVLTLWHTEDAEERIAALRMPALIAMGTLDAVIPPRNAELLAERLPDAWLAPFPGGGHAFMAQQPRRLAALIAAFLTDAS
jgi:pimeloyl-ACP methyl ester carboxylesterase